MALYAKGVDPEITYRHLKATENWFKCDRCGWIWPESRLVIQDGLRIDRDNCAKRMGADERTMAEAREAKRLVRREARTKEPKYPFVPEMRGVPGVSSLTPNEIGLIVGGAAVAMTLGGVNLSSSDTVTYTGGVTDSIAPAYAVDGLTAVLTVVAGGAVLPGDYDLYYNDNRFARVFKVRT